VPTLLSDKPSYRHTVSDISVDKVEIEISLKIFFFLL